MESAVAAANSEGGAHDLSPPRACVVLDAKRASKGCTSAANGGNLSDDTDVSGLEGTAIISVVRVLSEKCQFAGVKYRVNGDATADAQSFLCPCHFWAAVAWGARGMQTHRTLCEAFFRLLYIYTYI